MRALIRRHDGAPDEVMTEPFSPWVQANLVWLTGQERDEDGNAIKGDGWVLVEDWVEQVQDPTMDELLESL